jgi:ArsR family transcriptional regulator
MDKIKQVTLIKKQFAVSRRLLIAIGDETRQAILAALMETDCDGMRVGEITEQTHLSRPAVSHHLKILLDAGMVGVTPEGTKNYYWLRLGEEWDTFVALISNIEKLRALGGACDE